MIVSYHVPDATSKSAPSEFIEEPELPGGDGRRWEEERLAQSLFHTGAKDAQVCSIGNYNKFYAGLNVKKKEAPELLLEDEKIDFMEALQHIEGTLKPEVINYTPHILLNIKQKIYRIRSLVPRKRPN